jgi:threonine/homoserine/homoserine lactone efflux protein
MAATEAPGDGAPDGAAIQVANNPVFLCVIVLAGLGYLGYRAYERAVERCDERAKIAARADAQHRAFIAGDSSGIYGQ